LKVRTSRQSDFELMERWQKMYLQEPAAQGKNGAELELVQYINKSVDLRLAALLKYLTQSELRRLDVDVEDDWLLLADEIDGLIRAGASPKGKKARIALDKWSCLIDRTVGLDPALRAKFLDAFYRDPVLKAGAILSINMQIHWRRVAGAKGE